MSPRPNLLFVFSDQQSWDMLGCYGNRDLKTPSFDRLAAEGVRFNHCIATSPVCTPNRGILLSGLHPLQNGAFMNDLQLRPGKGNYLGEVLRDGGYHTGYFGKWHLYGGDRNRGIPPGPFRYGFDHEFLTNNCTLTFDERSWYWSQDGKEKMLYGDWEPYAQTRQALEFIESHAKDSEPFALFLSWHPPHNWGRAHEGYSAPADCLALYNPEKLTLRPTVEDTPQNRRAYQGHYAMISSLDRAFGQLLAKLEEKGLTENTIVVFTSDHGDLLNSYGWPNNKGRAESGSARVPFLLRWPKKLKPGTTSDLLLGWLDLMPTLLGLLSLPVPKTCQGRDASTAVLSGKNDDGTDALPLLFAPLNWRGVYTRRYPYSEALHPPGEANTPGGQETFNCLYDRQSDPLETKNLFHAPEAHEVRELLHTRTHALMERYGDKGIPLAELISRI